MISIVKIIEQLSFDYANVIQLYIYIKSIGI